jgi:hypothetical protein
VRLENLTRTISYNIYIEKEHGQVDDEQQTLDVTQSAVPFELELGCSSVL